MGIMKMPNNVKLLLLFVFVFSGAALNVNATGATSVGAQGIEVDADLGGGWSYSNVYGAFYDLGSGWNYSDWFGTFYTQDGSWFWRPGFGWTYLVDGSTPGNWWIYVYELSDWCWTSENVYPFVSSINAGDFVWFDEDILGFYNASTGQYAAGGVHNVDLVLSNTGIDQNSWNQIITSVRNSLAQTGYHNFYQFESSSNNLILRFNFGSQSIANAVRSAIQVLSGDYGVYSISIR